MAFALKKLALLVVVIAMAAIAEGAPFRKLHSLPMGGELCKAVTDGDLKQVQAALKKEGDPDRYCDITNDYPLHIAATWNYVDIIKALVKAGATVGAKNYLGQTALHTAVSWARLEATKTLLKLKAPVNAQTKSGDTPLHTASKWGSLMCVEELLKYNPDQTIKNTYGQLAKDVIGDYAEPRISDETRKQLEALLGKKSSVIA